MTFEQEKTNRSNDYIKSLKQADLEWEKQSTTKGWLLEILKDPVKAIKPSERFKQFFDIMNLNFIISKTKRNITIRKRIK